MMVEQKQFEGFFDSFEKEYAEVVKIAAVYPVQSVQRHRREPGAELLTGLDGGMAWANLLGLAILPTIVSTASLAIATRNIGATKASVLGVFEPITAILVGTLVFGEELTPNIIAGILISIVAVSFMIMLTKR